MLYQIINSSTNFKNLTGDELNDSHKELQLEEVDKNGN